MPGIRCPFCQQHVSDVIETQPIHGWRFRRRRYECAACHRRHTTVEMLETTRLRLMIRRRAHLSTAMST